MDRLKVERRGGFAGLPACGEIDTHELPAADRARLEALFRQHAPLPHTHGADRFTYCVTRVTATGSQTLEIPEHLLPDCLARIVKDTLP